MSDWAPVLLGLALSPVVCFVEAVLLNRFVAGEGWHLPWNGPTR